MANPWDELPSIWDGWTKQCFESLARDKDMAACYPGRRPEYFCAMGFVFFTAKAVRKHINGTASVFLHKLPPDTRRRLFTVERALRAAYRKGGVTSQFGGILAANDEAHWTPEQFRDLDRRLEYEYQLAQLGKQIDASVPAPEGTTEKEIADSVRALPA